MQNLNTSGSNDPEALGLAFFVVSGLLPPWQRRLCFWLLWLVCLSVCLPVDNITQKVMKGLG